MLMLGHFREFLPVKLAEFRFAVFDRVGSFNQVIAKESVAGTNAFRILGLEGARLMLPPNEARILGHGRLITETLNIADFGQDAGGVDPVNAGDRAQTPGSRNAFKHAFDRFVEFLELALDASDGLDRGAEHQSMESSTTLDRR